MNYNGWRDSQECLESLLKLDYSNYRIVLVDNNSPNDSMSHIIAWAKGEEVASVDNVALKHLSIPPFSKPLDYILYDKESASKGGLAEQEASLNNPLVFVQAGENKGFSAGNNVGIQYALAQNDAEYVWLLNTDTVVEPNALSELAQKALYYNNKSQKTGIIGSKLMYYYRPELIQAIGGSYNKWLGTSRHIGGFEHDNGQYDNECPQSIDYPVGASMFVSVDFIREVGLMCEDYFLYFEELDWVNRGLMRGWNVGYCWQSKIYHKEGGSIGSSSKPGEPSLFSEYYLLLNRLRFTHKFYPKLAFLVRLGFVLVLFNRSRRLQFSKFKQAFKIMFHSF